MSDLTFTTIEESARQKFGITRDEYALCNYIQTWSAHPDNRHGGYCDRTRGQMAKFIGISERGVIKMLHRMAGKNLVQMHPTAFFYRITALWFDAILSAKEERRGEQSSGLGVNKVQGRGEQSSGLGVNKVHPHKESSKEPHKERECPPAKTETSKQKNPVDEILPAGPAPKASWLDRPPMDTPLQLCGALSKLYQDYPEDYRAGIMDGAKASRIADSRRLEITLSYCAWAVENRRSAWDYRQHHARLCRWFIEQPAFEKAKPAGSPAQYETPRYLTT